MNLAEIKQLNILEPSCFESSQEEEWYECGLCDGAQIAEEELINKACDAYCKVCGHYYHTVPTHICRQDCDYYKHFEELLEQEV